MAAEQAYILAAESEVVLKDRGSRFIAYAFPAFSIEECRQQLRSLREKYPDATHHCYAYILDDPSISSGFGDDGEPSNSAGRPILRQLVSRKLHYSHVVVVRYFGGTKLGVPGLIEAYGEAASMAIEKAGLTIYTPSETWQINTDYANENLAYRIIRQNGGTILGRSSGGYCSLLFRIPVEKIEKLREICLEIPIFELIQLT
jgi:uncharacterized YigZ family protein